MKPLPFQKEDILQVERWSGRAILAHEMGLGKTLMALGYLRRNPEALPALVVCPAIIKYHWQQEAMKAVGLDSVVLEGRKPSWFPSKPLTIINYDILPWWANRLRKIGFKTLVLDECHRVKSPSAKRTKAVTKLGRQMPHVLALSGTPLMNKPMELWTVLNLLHPKQFKSRMKFAHKFCGAEWTPWGWKFDGASHTEKLHTILTEHCMVRRRKMDVLKDLPPKLRQVIPLPLSNRAEYNHACDDFLGWLEEQSPDKANRASKAIQMARIGYLLRLAAKLKLRSAVDWINEWLEQNPGDKLVVFANHRKCLSALERKCRASSVLIDGSVSGRDRNKMVGAFQNSSDPRLFLGNMHAAGEGITLTAAHHVVFVELDWVPAVLRQAEDRCHRIGTTDTVWCTYLVAHDTVEESLCRIIQKKQRVMSEVLDGGPVAEDLNVFDELVSSLNGRCCHENQIRKIQSQDSDPGTDRAVQRNP